MTVLHRLFTQQAEATPRARAVIDGSVVVTYEELDARSNQLAHYLLTCGVETESLVGICLQRSANLIVAILAVLKAGGAYVPIDPDTPSERIAYILRDSAARLILVEKETAGLCDPADVRLGVLDEQWGEIECFPRQPVVSSAGPGSLAYVIYTSGSTGRPKGVLITHSNVCKLISSARDRFGFHARDVWTLFHSVAFDFSVWELFGALLHGAALVVVPYEVSRSPQRFLEQLSDARVSVLNQTPTAFRNLVQVLSEFSGRPLALRLIIFGGEALQVDVLRQWYTMRGTATQLINMYGITETTVHVTYRSLTPEDARHRKGTPIGVPLPGMVTYVLDEKRRVLPPNFPGELYVGGSGVARGYLGRPELTCERFIANPFCTEAGSRLYRTGDLVRATRSGELEYIGRIDRQVKIRGHRIELAEIEARLCECRDVGQSLVLAVERETQKRLMAWIVPRSPACVPSVDSLHEHLAAHLPDYMLPSRYFCVEAFPLTTNGKIDQGRLPGISTEEPVPQAESTAAYSERAAILMSVWRDVLGAKVGLNDNFYALGGDSIRAVQVAHAARLRGVPFKVRLLLRHQTIARLCAAIDREPAAEIAAAPLHRLETAGAARWKKRADVADAYPLTDMQRLMVSAYERSPPGVDRPYHSQEALFLEGSDWNPGAFREALGVLVTMHPALRTSIHRDDDDGYVQVVWRERAIRIDIEDLSGLAEADQDAAVALRLQSDRARPFRLDEAGGMMRLAVFNLGPRRHVFMKSAHHAIEDGWGNYYFLNELFRLYAGNCVGGVEADQTFREFVAHEHAARRDDQALAFWRKQRLSGCQWLPPQNMDHDNTEPRGTAFLTSEVLERLRAHARGLGVSLKALTLNAYFAVLRASASEPAVVGVVVNGRSDLLSRPLTSLGMFWNIVPIRGPEIIDPGSASAVQRQLVDVEQFPMISLAAIQEIHGGRELFHATFNFVEFHQAVPPEAAGLAVSKVLAYDRFHFALNLAVAVDASGGGAMLRVEYDPGRLSRAAVGALLERYVVALDLLAGGCQFSP